MNSNLAVLMSFKEFVQESAADVAGAMVTTEYCLSSMDDAVIMLMVADCIVMEIGIDDGRLIVDRCPLSVCTLELHDGVFERLQEITHQALAAHESSCNCNFGAMPRLVGESGSSVVQSEDSDA